MANEFEAGATGQNASSEGKPVTAAAPNISLPKGGGALRGIGEKFAANPVTGTGTVSVPITTSRGRSGFGPQLALAYDSGAGNGPFGFGWQIALPAISRKTEKGLPRYDDPADSDVFVLSGAEDLVPEFRRNVDGEFLLGADGKPIILEDLREGYRIRHYRPRIEGLFARIERWTLIENPADVHWRSISKDNVLTIYGADLESRIADPTPIPVTTASRIFSWLISETRDDKGNGILYQYKREDGAGLDLTTASEAHRGGRGDARRAANRYLKRIHYGNRESLLSKTGDRPTFIDAAAIQAQISSGSWMFEVVFDYGEHGVNAPAPSEVAAWTARMDQFSTRRAGFEVRTSRLCRRVLMFHHFDGEPDVGRDCLVASTDLVYSDPNGPDDIDAPTYSFLESVTRSGYRRKDDGYLRRSTPKTEFEYSQAQISNQVQSLDPDSQENLPIGIDGIAYQWLDLHGEGVPGIFTEQSGGWFYRRNLSPAGSGGANFGPLECVALKPNLSPIGGTISFMDLEGDGHPDLVVLDGAASGFHEHDEAQGWEPFRSFASSLTRSLDDANVRLIDLSGDGRTDVLIAEGDALLWYRSLGEMGFEPALRIDLPEDDARGPRLLFTDETSAVLFADMTGDGLPDLIRVTACEVSYWPSLGYGHFGSKVSMNNPPRLDSGEAFDPRRVQLADIDGSGTADLIYLREEGVDLYFNLCGDAWSKAKSIDGLRIDSLVMVRPFDLLGNGTACLVWSSRLPSEVAGTLRYVDLMGGTKPHLLTRVKNNMGAETRFAFTSSTKFYVADQLAGNPWITRLPFPVHVVERVETVDTVSNNLFVTRYAYHNGYFDGVEREFRGFGLVEQWDTESFAAFTADGQLAANIEDGSHVPAVHTKSWFHTGAPRGIAALSRVVGALLDQPDRAEYFREPGRSASEIEDMLLPDTAVPQNLDTSEQREALRALKGEMLRHEVYALDHSAKAAFPYAVTERNFAIICMQPRGNNQHAVFQSHPQESLTFDYERNPFDPRISHCLTLEVDSFGNPLKTAEAVYPRRSMVRAQVMDGTWHDVPNPGLAGLTRRDIQQQTQTLITYREYQVTNVVDEPGDYRAPLQCEQRQFELAGYQKSGPGGRFLPSDLVEDNPDHHGRQRLKFTRELSYEEAMPDSPPAGSNLRRTIEQSRVLLRNDDLSGLAAFGRLPRRAVPGESYTLALTAGVIAALFVRDGEVLLPDVADVLVREGGYLASETLKADGRFSSDVPDGQFWIPSGRTFYSSSQTDDAAMESAAALLNFFVPVRFVDAFGHVQTVTYDPHTLLPIRATDAVGSVTEAGNDYRMLQPTRVTDLNGNRTDVRFDALGFIVGTAVSGKTAPGAAEGDSFSDFVEDLDPAAISAFFAAPDPHEGGAALLGTASSRLLYDFEALPVSVATIARETHVSDLVGGASSRLHLSFSYSDGFSRAAGNKVQAEPGPVPQRDPNGRILTGSDGQPIMTTNDRAPRWVGTGWTVFNNKGDPVRRYEPFFTDTHKHEPDVRIGVSSTLFYDPQRRLIGTLYPDHTWQKTSFGPWDRANYDTCDTILPQPGLAGPTDDVDIGDFFARLPQAAYLPTWHDLRTLPVNAAAFAARYPDPVVRASETEAAMQAAQHAGTPSRTHLNSAGRAFLKISDNGPDPSDLAKHRLLESRFDFDIEGNLCLVRDALQTRHDRSGVDGDDPLGRIVARYGYGMLGRRLREESMESGRRWSLHDVSGKPLRTFDDRGHVNRIEYDALRRVLRHFVKNADPAAPGREILVERLVYGEQHPDAEARNLRGQIFLHLDQVGAATTEACHFNGGVIRTTRRMTSGTQYRSVVDWSDVDANHTALPPIATSKADLASLATSLASRVQADTYVNRMTYDALGRPIQVVAPHLDQSSTAVSIIQPTYNEANLLEVVRVWLDETELPSTLLDIESATFTAVRNIDYDARGRRVLIAYGAGAGPRTDGAVSTYRYDPLTSRLVGLKTARPAALFPGDDLTPIDPNAPGAALQNLSYTYDPAGNVTRIRDFAQQAIYFRNKRVEPTSAFTYDALYRLVEARGREHLGQTAGAANAPSPHSYNDASRTNQIGGNLPGQFSPNDGNAMGTYIERYAYDDAGNILSMQHLGDDPRSPGWTRSYSYDGLSEAEVGDAISNRLSSTQIGTGPSERYTYDAHGNMASMPQLQQLLWNYSDLLQMTQRQRVNDNDSDGGERQGERTYYVYDAAGERVRKVTERSDGSSKDERLYFGVTELYFAHVGRGAGLVRETLHVMDGHVAIVAVETRNEVDDGSAKRLTRYQLCNHLGSSVIELDENARLISYEEFTPYGSTSYQAVRNLIDAPKRYRFCGQERDEESGLSQHGARYYAPWLGRWTSPDPIGIGDGLNLYAYCTNNPVSFVDTTGTQTKASEPSVLGVIDRTLEAKGIAYNTEVMVKIEVNGGPTVIRIYDRVYQDPSTKNWVAIEAKGGRPNKLTPSEIASDKLVQERGGRFEVLRSAGKPPGTPKAQGINFTKGYKGQLKPGDLHYAHGNPNYKGSPLEPNALDISAWREGMNAHPNTPPANPGMIRKTQPNKNPTYLTPEQQKAEYNANIGSKSKPQPGIGKPLSPPKAAPTAAAEPPPPPPPPVTEAAPPVSPPAIGSAAPKPGAIEVFVGKVGGALGVFLHVLQVKTLAEDLMMRNDPSNPSLGPVGTKRVDSFGNVWIKVAPAEWMTQYDLDHAA